MASTDAEIPEQSSSFYDRFLRQRDLSLFLPFFLGFSDTQSEAASTRDRIILINPFTQGMVVVEGGPSRLDTTLRDLGHKGGQPPATKASIDALPEVEHIEGNELHGECVICLEEFWVGLKVKEMPCSHRFHSGCIEKWLNLHGTCPVCRDKMPVDEEKDKNGEEMDSERMESDIWVSFSFNGNRNRDNQQSSESHPVSLPQ